MSDAKSDFISSALSKPFPAAVTAFRVPEHKLEPVTDPAISHDLTDAGQARRLVDRPSGSPASLTEDLLLLWAAVRDGDPIRPYFSMSPRVAVWLAAQRSGDGPMFPRINATTGGDIFGVPVALSPVAQSTIILLDASALAGSDNGLTVDSSTAGALQMRDDPVTGATSVVSLFQRNATALAFTRYLSWALAYEEAIAFISLDLPAAGSPE